MPHELRASLRVTLPEGAKEGAAALAAVSAEWAKFCHALPGEAEMSLAVAEPVRRRRRGRLRQVAQAAAE